MNYPNYLNVKTLELEYKTSNFQLWPIGQQFSPKSKMAVRLPWKLYVFEAKMSTVLQFLGNIITLPDEQEK